jgi:hypothetical protein
LHLEVDTVSEDSGEDVVVELALHGVGIPGVENELADAWNGGGRDEDAFPVLLKNFADVFFDAVEFFDLARIREAGARGGLDEETLGVKSKIERL